MTTDIPEFAQLDKILVQLAQDTAKLIDDKTCWVGIQSGGVLLAQYLKEQLKFQEEIGKLDINFFRDDLHHLPLPKPAQPSRNLPNIDGMTVILIDDILWTGRTVRAALNELFEFGRPKKVYLVVLFDRVGRQLPIQADVRGQTIDLSDNQQVKLVHHDNKLDIKIIAQPPRS